MNNIIDIRSSYEYNLFHLDNSINIPKLVLLNDPNLYLNRNTLYYIICSKGIESNYVSNILTKLGYNCQSVNGGIEKYKNK